MSHDAESGGDMGKAPAFQFYAADFLMGTAEMSPDEVGVYIRLMAASWDKGPLPTDHARLARLGGATLEQFEIIWAVVGQKWMETPKGLVNERLEALRAERDAFAQAQAARGRKGAHRRWDGERHSPSNGAGNAQAMAQAQPDDSSSVFGLQSSKKERDRLPVDADGRTLTDSGAWNGNGRPRHSAIQGSHVQCDRATADACARGACIPVKLTAQWRTGMAAAGWSPARQDDELRATVAQGLAEFKPDEVIGEDGFTLWPRVWKARHQPTKPKSPDGTVWDADAGRRTREMIEAKRRGVAQ